MDAIILTGEFHGEPNAASQARNADPFIRVDDRTFFDHVLAWLAQTGVTRAIIASEGPLPGLHEQYPDGRAHGLELVACPADPGAGTGGALRRAATRALHSDTFVVIRADRFLPVDPQVLERRRARAGVDVAMALVDAPTGSPRARVQLDDAWRVTHLEESGSSWIDAGMYAFRRHGLLAFDGRDGFDLATEGLRELEGRIAGLVFPGPIADLKQPSTLAEVPWSSCGNGAQRPGSLPT